MIKNFYIFLMVFLSIIGGCNLTENEVNGEIPSEKNQETIILFCPEDNCEENLIKIINFSRKSVHCALYDLKLERISDILKEKSKEVGVKVIFEKDNYHEQIIGDNIRLDNNNYYMHNKFCIIDGSVVWTGSFNPTERGAYKNNNNVVVIYSKFISDNFEEEFQELWNYKSDSSVKNPIVNLNDIKIENYFCPDDHCADQVIELIDNAKESIYFMTFSFTSEDIADAILYKDKNVDIKGIFETTQAGSEYSQFKRLKDFGLDVIKDKNGYNMHHKVFIIDEKIVITGSFNPTKSGDLRNDENVIIIHDNGIAEKYLKEFEKIWFLE